MGSRSRWRKTGLKETGFAFDHVIDGEDGMHLALTEPYDMAVVMAVVESCFEVE